MLDQIKSGVSKLPLENIFRDLDEEQETGILNAIAGVSGGEE